MQKFLTIFAAFTLFSGNHHIHDTLKINYMAASIKAIVFDMGGVLLDLDPEACFKACREDLGFERVAEFVGPCHQKGLFMRLEEGAISPEEFYDGVLEMSAPGKTREDVISAFKHFLIGIEPYKVQLIQELSTRYDLYMLSNNNAMCMNFAREEFGCKGVSLEKEFKKLFLSYEMHLLKPGDGIFQESIREIGRLSGTPQSPVTAKEMLFIDDSPANVEAALRNGMRAVHYSQGDDLRAVLEQALESRTFGS